MKSSELSSEAPEMMQPPDTSDVEEAVILPYADVGRHCRLSKVVIDHGVKIPEGLVVGEDPEADAARFRRTEQGVCLITQPMINRLG